MEGVMATATATAAMVSVTVMAMDGMAATMMDGATATQQPRNGNGRCDGKATATMAMAMYCMMAPQWQGMARRLLDGDGQRGTARLQRHGQRNDNSTVIDLGARRQWTARGQLNGKGRRIGDTTTMDNKDGTSAMGMSLRLTM